MSFVQVLRRQARLHAFWAPRRCLASQSAPAAAPQAAPDATGASPKAGGGEHAFHSFLASFVAHMFLLNLSPESYLVMP